MMIQRRITKKRSRKRYSVNGMEPLVEDLHARESDSVRYPVARSGISWGKDDPLECLRQSPSIEAAPFADGTHHNKN
jgi:hypothetical protein